MGTHNPAKIGVSTATIVGMNAMIGSGIFVAPIALSHGAGPAGILAYLLVVPAVWLMALSIARLAQLYPQEGSFYTYARQWGGHIVGLITICAYFIGLVIAMGLLAQAAGQAIHEFVPQHSGWTLGLIALWGLTILNMLGVPLSEIGQKILIICTIFPLITTTILCLLHADFSHLTPFAPNGYLEVFKATRAVIFGFFGFECAASLFNIVRNPEKNVPKALAYSISIVGFIYVLFVFSLLLAVPQSLFSSESDLSLADILVKAFPEYPILISAITISFISAVLGTMHSMLWSSSHLLQFIVKKLKPDSFIPFWLAVLVVGSSITITFLTLHDANLFFSLTAIFLVFAYASSMLTLLTLQSEWQSGQNIKTILGLLTAAVIFIFAAEGLYGALIA